MLMQIYLGEARLEKFGHCMQILTQSLEKSQQFNTSNFLKMIHLSKEISKASFIT